MSRMCVYNVHVFHHNFIRSEINSYDFPNIVIYEEKKKEEENISITFIFNI